MKITATRSVAFMALMIGVAALATCAGCSLFGGGGDHDDTANATVQNRSDQAITFFGDGQPLVTIAPGETKTFNIYGLHRITWTFKGSEHEVNAQDFAGQDTFTEGANGYINTSGDFILL